MAVVERDLHAEAEERLGRSLTSGEKLIDLAGNDSLLETAKEQLVTAIEMEKRRAVEAVVTDRPYRMRVTQRMAKILLDLHLAGKAAATAEVEAQGLSVPRAYAVDAEAVLADLVRQLRLHLTGIERRVHREHTDLSIGETSQTAMIRALDRRIPGARNAAAEVISKAFGSGLGVTFERASALFTSWVYSAVMDGATCSVCKAHDGTVYDSWEAIQVVLPDGGPNPACHGGGRCRCRPVPGDHADTPASGPVQTTEPDYDLTLLPDYARRPVGELTHAQAKDEIKRLGTYASRLQKHVRDGTRPPTHQLKVDAMLARREHLRSRLLLPDLEGATPIPTVRVTTRQATSLRGAVKQFKERHALDEQTIEMLNDIDSYHDDLIQLGYLTRGGGIGPKLVEAEAALRDVGARVASEVEAALGNIAVAPTMSYPVAVGRFEELFDRAERLRVSIINELIALGESRTNAINLSGLDPRFLALVEQREAARQTMRAAQDALRDGGENIAKRRAEATSQVLASVRAMNGKLKHGARTTVSPSEKADLARSSHIKTDTYSVDTARELVDQAAERLPASWIKASNNRTDRVKPGYPRLFVWLTTGRAHYRDLTGRLLVSLGRSTAGYAPGFSTALHELAHRMEYSVPGIRTFEWVFFKRRVAESGKRTAKLSHLTGNRSYGAQEIANPDGFVDPYIGRIYGFGDVQPYDAFEVLSMGMEGVFSGEYDLWIRDPDHRDFVLGLLALM